MRKKQPIKKPKKPITLPKPGSSPGYLHIDDEALNPQIQLYIYAADSYLVKSLHEHDLDKIKTFIADENKTCWVEIKGFNSRSMFDAIGRELNINKLTLEDITHTYQRAKFEEYQDYNFAISRMLYLTDENTIENIQIAFILTGNTLFTFQDVYDDFLEAVKKRLIGGKGNIRIAGSSYLMYAIMDAVVDNYFSILGKFAEQLESLEEKLLDKPDKYVMIEAQRIKRNLITLRRAVWPERDKLNDIIRTEDAYVSDTSKFYFKDVYDHTIQIIDMIESQKEITAGNIDLYLSIISNRMNEIMKVLTIISSVFIPLTFIAGIYGMNFAREDPKSGKFLPANMPELYAEHGYLYTLIVMLVIALAQIVYFWRKGWFK